VRVSEVIIQFESLYCCFFRVRESFSGRKISIAAEAVIAIGQSSIGQRKARVPSYRLIEILNSSLESFFCSLVPEKPALQVILIRLCIFGGAFCKQFLICARQPQSQLIGDFLGYLILHGQNVCELAIQNR
jgi:hypothetical protein